MPIYYKLYMRKYFNFINFNYFKNIISILWYFKFLHNIQLKKNHSFAQQQFLFMHSNSQYSKQNFKIFYI
jgi:hypothetical protein